MIRTTTGPPESERLAIVRRETLRTLRTARFLARTPAELRHVPKWVASFVDERSPVEQRRPWMPFAAQEWLAGVLESHMRVFEFGSGGSTLFIAPRVRELVSVEHDPEWHRAVTNMLGSLGIDNCHLVLVEPELGSDTRHASHKQSYAGRNFRRYASFIEGQENSSLDLVIVDGRARMACVEYAVDRVRPGGYIVLDNSERSHYEAAGSMLSTHRRMDFEGLLPARTHRGKTTVWQIGEEPQ